MAIPRINASPRRQVAGDLLGDDAALGEELQAALVEIRQDAVQVAVDLAGQR